ncbi:MAG TPA: YdcF family protein, partial [Bacillota bacterium]|nr:YdcF family protein [Bacillota bacterium]
MDNYDAILIPGGGITPEFQPTPWTVSRLDYALSVTRPKYFITLSAGTTHHPPFIDQSGFPAFESIINANYLIHKGVTPTDIMAEKYSYDTIGNAFFARFLFTEILSLARILVITSEFHMPRTKAIFEWLFNLPPQKAAYDLTFVETPNTGLNQLDLEA